MDRHYLEKAKAEGEAVRQALDQAQALADKSPALVRLKADVPKARDETDRYAALVGETEKRINTLSLSREAMEV